VKFQLRALSHNARLFLFHTFVSCVVVWWIGGKITTITYGLRSWLSIGAYSTQTEFAVQYAGLLHCVTGVLVGYVLSRFWMGATAKWVWVLPSLYLLYNALFWHDMPTSVLVGTHWYDGVKHYFVDPCSFNFPQQLAPDCIDKMFVTGIFYCSASYSLGALLGKPSLRSRDSENMRSASG
jgi:hypothetical protein